MRPGSYLRWELLKMALFVEFFHQTQNTNIRLGQKGFLGTYDPAYLASSSFRKKKSFITLTTGLIFQNFFSSS
jgi:hypothetical protein